jgi:hypothetical protein
MEQKYVAPIDHGVVSATATTAFEASKSGLKGMVKGLFSGTIIGGALAGELAGILSLTAGIASLGALGTTATIGGVLLGAVSSTLTFAAIGATVGTLAMFLPFISGPLLALGMGIGLVKGTSRGVERVSQERGAANELNAQVAAYQAQAMAQAPANDNKDKYGFAPQGSHMNPAGSTVSAMQADGTLAGQQLSAAR